MKQKITTEKKKTVLTHTQHKIYMIYVIPILIEGKCIGKETRFFSVLSTRTYTKIMNSLLITLSILIKYKS